MKLSTKIKKYCDPEYKTRPIKMMVDCGLKETAVAGTLAEADERHKEFLAKGYTLLPLNECPVINDKEIVMHYTSTTYAKWCNVIVDANKN